MAESDDLGWVGSRIWARGEGLETSKKGESRKGMGRYGRWGNILLSSCEKLGMVLAVLLVGAVCQHAPLKIQINANVQNTEISDL